ncbi:Multidrug resistance protein MdtA [bioreactor metagenome]|uniref:Multidrug resistance protein MdtA n=1 Tax=bioreactor metagenome TaxID=1076179 RepID=A0A644X8V7_9ZZZZ
MKLVLPFKKKKSEPSEDAAGEKKPKYSRPRKKLKKKTIVLLIILGILIIAGCVGLYFLFFAKDEATIITGETTTGSLTTTLEGTGTTIPADSVTYTFASDADIKEVDVAAGDTVAAGDQLYVQDDTEVYDEIATYQENIADLNTKLDDYNNTLTTLNENIANLTITAPFSGRLTEVDVEDGDTIKSGDTMAVLVDDSKMKVTQYFSYAYEDDIYVGMPGVISIADQMLTLDAAVTSISKVERITTEGTRCFAVTMEITNPGSLTEGLTGAGYLLSKSGEKLYPAVEGTLEYASSKTITAKVSGDLTYMNAVDYQKVTKGETLFKIDGTTYENQLSSVTRNIASTNESISSYNDRITQAQESLANYTVTSSIAGKVIMVRASVGKTPTEGGTSVVVYNLDSMEVSIDVDELDIDNITMGMSVDIIQTGSETDTTYKGTVTAISYEATNTDGVAYFPITVSVDSQGALSPGVNVSYKITIGDAEEGVLAPIAALKTTDEGTCLFIKADSKPASAIDLGDDVDIPDGYYAVPVETGVSDSTNVRILSGVDAGVTVFLRYQESAPSNGDTTSENADATTTTATQNFGPPGGMSNMGGGGGGGPMGG